MGRAGKAKVKLQHQMTKTVPLLKETLNCLMLQCWRKERCFFTAVGAKERRKGSHVIMFDDMLAGEITPRKTRARQMKCRGKPLCIDGRK